MHPFRPIVRAAIASFLLGASGLVVPAAAVAQVGHPPQHSPYHDIPRGHTITPYGGWFGGKGGSLRVGPHGGWVYGVRYDIRTNQFVQLGIDISRGDLDRFVVNPFIQVANRLSGPIGQSVTSAEATLQFNLTGGKRWHSIAPYFANGFGVAFGGGAAPGDTSGYRFKNKFFFAPTVGTRIFLGNRVHLRLEARSVFWKLTYPASFSREPPLDPGTTTNPHAVIPGGDDAKLSEWVATPVLRFGIGIAFRP